MDNLDMDSLELPDMDGDDYDDVPQDENPWEAEHSENPNRPAEAAEDYEFDINDLPVIEEMSDLGSGKGAPGASGTSDPAKSMGAPGIADMQKPSNAPKTPDAAGGSSMSARERRMAEPFDMPGAYNPAEKNAPPAATRYQSSTGAGYPSANTYRNTNRDDALDAMYADRARNYEEGKGKVRVLAIIMMVVSGLSLIGSLLSKDYLSAAFTAFMIYSAVRFMKGSNTYRVWLGRFSAIESIWGIFRISQISKLLGQVGQLGMFDSSAISMAKTMAFIVIGIQVAYYGVMAYFLLFNDKISDYTTDD